ncbi:MAG: T9SS type A sorting domain-containing protein [Ignavibacteria bacterium]|nr:T9SS type A sorting domain-containing protein [Ignavibacteria bacterium]
MKKLNYCITALMFLCMVSQSRSQLSQYSFQQFGSSYSEITGGTVVGSATATTGNGASLDDTIFTAQPLPFTFNFNGIDFTTYSISSNGFITFGATNPAANLFTPISSNTGYDGAISVLGRDIQGVFSTNGSRSSGSPVISNVNNFSGIVAGKLISGGGIPQGTTVVSFDESQNTVTMSANATTSNPNFTFTVASGEIMTESFGPIGQKLLVIQFKNFRKFNALNDNFNFQITLFENFETPNQILFSYGSFVCNNTNASAQVGLRGANNNLFRTRAGGNWASSVEGLSNNSTMALVGNSVPPTGQGYTWNTPLTDDMGAISANLINGRIFSTGKGYDFDVKVKNFGVNVQNVVPVYFTVNGGSPVGPVSTTGPIVPGDSETVSFNGGFAFTTSTSGINVVKIYTALTGDGAAYNDTITLNVPVGEKISAYPYLETFTDAQGWSVRIERNGPGNSTPLWILGTCTNPTGAANDTAARCNFFGPNNNTGKREILRSPEFDMSALTNPVLNFYVSYRTYQTANDTIEVLVSTDAGITFFSASTVYNKSNNSTPSLATRGPSNTNFVPDSANKWRSETISLANVAGSGNVIIGFRGKSNYGNNAWIDNVVVTEANSLCSETITQPGIFYRCNNLLQLVFTDIGLTPPWEENGPPGSPGKIEEEVLSAGTFSDVQTDANINVVSGTNTDNPLGGDATVVQHTNVVPPSVAAVPIAPNTTATTNDGSIFTPAIVYKKNWFTVTYTGNDRLGYSKYYVFFDVSNMNLPNPDKVYIVKRSDMTDSWQCLNTVNSGGILAAFDLTTFCDFAVAGNDQPLPVELASFVSVIHGNNVTLNWSTSTETNNAGFDIERSGVTGSWSKIGSVSGNGTTSTPHSYSYTDKAVATGKYNYRLKQTDFNGNFEYHNLGNEVNIGVPEKFDLSQNYPNPFNPSTKINYDLPSDGNVSIKLFDISDKEVALLVNEVKTAGYHTVELNASNLSSGVYFYRISVDANGNNFIATKRMMLLK